jgi:hypothetical protein
MLTYSLEINFGFLLCQVTFKVGLFYFLESSLIALFLWGFIRLIPVFDGVIFHLKSLTPKEPLIFNVNFYSFLFLKLIFWGFRGWFDFVTEFWLMITATHKLFGIIECFLDWVNWVWFNVGKFSNLFSAVPDSDLEAISTLFKVKLVHLWVQLTCH